METVTGEAGAPLATEASLAPVAGGPAAPVQVTVGASAVLAAQVVKRFVRICALAANGNPVYVNNMGGTASATAGDELNPGDTKDYPVTNANKLSVFGTASDKINVSYF